MLKAMNTHLVGFVGVYTGGATVLGAIAAFFALLTNPQYDVALYGAIIRGSQHLQTQDDILTIAKLAAAFIAIIGGFIAALVASYFGRPATISGGKPG